MCIYVIMALVDFGGIPRVMFWALHSGLSDALLFGYRVLRLLRLLQLLRGGGFGGFCRSGGQLGWFGSEF